MAYDDVTAPGYASYFTFSSELLLDFCFLRSPPARRGHRRAAGHSQSRLEIQYFCLFHVQ